VCTIQYDSAQAQNKSNAARQIVNIQAIEFMGNLCFWGTLMQWVLSQGSQKRVIKANHFSTTKIKDCTENVCLQISAYQSNFSLF
jgi:hypothetical protein